MGVLYQMCAAVTAELENRHGTDPMALLRAKGALATKTGFLVTLVSPRDPDDVTKIARVVEAAAELHIPL